MPHPTVTAKLRQLWRLVRESHAEPLTGQPHKPLLAAADETAITFIGHSSFLIQTGGRSLLIDPVFATRLILMRRQRRPGVLVRDLPPIDAVLLTHAHMDHLNLPSLRAVCREMRRRKLPAPLAIVPRGVTDLVAKLGFSPSTSWTHGRPAASPQTRVRRVRIPGPGFLNPRPFRSPPPPQSTGAPACSKTLTEGSAATSSPRSTSRAFTTPATPAYFHGFREIGTRLHPDVAMLPIGAYFPDTYRAVHTSPEEALRAFQECGAATMIPMHYGTFRLGREPMSEPLPRLLAAATRAGLRESVLPLEEGATTVVAPRAAQALAS